MGVRLYPNYTSQFIQIINDRNEENDIARPLQYLTIDTVGLMFYIGRPRPELVSDPNLQRVTSFRQKCDRRHNLK
jgi:hypothetical protein